MTTPVDLLTQTKGEKHDLTIKLLTDIFRRLERLEAEKPEWRVTNDNADGYRFIKHPDLADASTALIAALVRRFDNGTLSGIPTEAARVCLALGFKTAREVLEAELDKPVLLATNVRGQ